jgi:hypothetical protein
VQARPLFLKKFFCFFFYFSETKPVWALEARRSPRLGASERACTGGRRATPDSLRAEALGWAIKFVFYFIFESRSDKLASHATIGSAGLFFFLVLAIGARDFAIASRLF